MTFAYRVRQHADKVLHLVAGTAITAVVGQLHPLMGTAVCLAAAWIKEDRDRRNPARHTRDGWDAYATAAGVLPGQVVLEFVSLQLLARLA